MASFYTDEVQGDVPAGAAFDAWRLRGLSRSDFGSLSAKERLTYFASWALLAPTTHNTVPQRFELRPTENAIGFWIDRARVLAESDPVGRQATISVGCAVENAARAASAYGFATTVEPAEAEVLPGTGRIHVATARFVEGAAGDADDTWLSAMKRRKMIRAVFDETAKLEPGLADQLRARVAAIHPGLALHVLTDAPTKLLLGKFQELADSTVINRERFARELGAWLLPNDSSSSIGMRGCEFGLPDGPAAHLHRGLLGQEQLLPDETAGFAKTGNLGMRSASAVGVICVARDDTEHRLAAGRAYEQLALALVCAGYVTAMHAGITEVEAPNRALCGRLRTLQRPTVVWRIGKPQHAEDGARPHSARPSLQDVLLE